MISKKNILNLEARNKIYNFISKNPGLHVREISRRINIPVSTLNYHIRYLKKIDLIEEEPCEKYKRIYAAEKISTKDKKILNLFRKKIPCRIFLHLIFAQRFSQKELSRELEIPPQKVSYYLKKMIDMEIIEEATVKNGVIYPFTNGFMSENVGFKCKPVGREIFYRRKNQKIINTIYRLFISYKHSLPDKDYINEYIDYLESIEKLKKFYQNSKKRKIFPGEESFYDVLYEIIKPPFCA